MNVQETRVKIAETRKQAQAYRDADIEEFAEVTDRIADDLALGLHNFLTEKDQDDD